MKRHFPATSKLRVSGALIVATGIAAAIVVGCRTPARKVESDIKNVDQSSQRLLPLNLEAGTKVLYEMQIRSANACDPSVGSESQKQACARKPAPKVVYRAKGMSCPTINDLNRIKLGTIEDMLAETADYRAGITLRYVKEKVGANMIWLMPPFPNNDIESIPHECDNLGSPYAVRDYMHITGTASQSCIAKNSDEYSATPCWGNNSFDQLIQKAHSLGIKVMVDVAFNHFGHGYLMYDYAEHLPVRERIARGEDLNKLWNFDESYEENLVKPALLDTPAMLEQLAAKVPAHRDDLAKLKAKCPALNGSKLVVAYNAWKNALNHERESFSCDNETLENRAPGFYMGANRQDPSTGPGNFFTNNWRDVKFLYHRSANPLKQHEMIRNREYLFRVMNYWVSRGVDGFRLDHATDGDSGLDQHTWHYILAKTNYYAAKRGQAKPIYHAEEFFNQSAMDQVADILTEGYVHGITGRSNPVKNTNHVEDMTGHMSNFKAYKLTALETHDEPRLLEGTGFNIWTGAGFWGAGATTRSTPMVLAGQEFGEPWGLGFKRSDYLRSRFEGSSNWNPDGEKLRSYYQKMITSRLASENRALYSQNFLMLRTKNRDNPIDDRIFAQVKWSDDLNVVFVFHKLWKTNDQVEQTYFLDDNIASAIGMRPDLRYKMIDILAGKVEVDCRHGADIKWEFPIKLESGILAKWLRMEKCD